MGDSYNLEFFRNAGVHELVRYASPTNLSSPVELESAYTALPDLGVRIGSHTTRLEVGTQQVSGEGEAALLGWEHNGPMYWAVTNRFFSQGASDAVDQVRDHDGLVEGTFDIASSPQAQRWRLVISYRPQADARVDTAAVLADGIRYLDLVPGGSVQFDHSCSTVSLYFVLHHASPGGLRATWEFD